MKPYTEDERKQLPKTIEEAQQTGHKHFYTGVECKHGHLSSRTVAGNRCMRCRTISDAKRYKLDPGKFCRAREAHKQKHPLRHLLSLAKTRAANKDLPFNITEEDLHIPTHCPVLGIKLIRGLTKKGATMDNSPSLDRIVPHLGYIKGNVEVISTRANMIKNNATPEELMTIALYYNRDTDND